MFLFTLQNVLHVLFVAFFAFLGHDDTGLFLDEGVSAVGFSQGHVTGRRMRDVGSWGGILHLVAELELFEEVLLYCV